MVKKLDNSNILDLHGVKHEDVERLVENFVLLNNKPLEIITGNSDRMERIVVNKLCELNVGWNNWIHGRIKIL
jgi:hypothetical protein